MKNKGCIENIKNVENLSEKGKEVLSVLLPKENVEEKDLSVFFVSDNDNVLSKIRQLVNLRVDEDFYALSVAFVTENGLSSYTVTHSRMAYPKSRVYSWVKRVAKLQNKSDIIGLRLGMRKNKDNSCWNYFVVMKIF